MPIPPFSFPSRIFVCCRYNNEINETGRWYISTKRRHFKNNTFRGKRQRNFRLLSVYLGYLFAPNAKFWTMFIRLKEVFSFQMIRKNAFCSLHFARCTAGWWWMGEIVLEISLSLLQHFSWNTYLICESDIWKEFSNYHFFRSLKQLPRW